MSTIWRRVPLEGSMDGEVEKQSITDQGTKHGGSRCLIFELSMKIFGFIRTTIYYLCVVHLITSSGAFSGLDYNSEIACGI